MQTALARPPEIFAMMTSRFRASFRLAAAAGKGERIDATP